MANEQNLRPISADPERARAQAKLTGFGSGHQRLCAGMAKHGGRCRNVAAFGTDKCIKHGARKLAGKPSPNRDVREARESIKNVPRDLQRTAEWLATDTMGARTGLLRKASLLAAWRQAEQGDWGPWRNLTTM